ncbi:MAG TPA: hypothetical protein VNN22_26230 [Verrucomicrobiae bacterium]|nr:hypothetical protein [Verrucomicrobiae bacterium]
METKPVPSTCAALRRDKSVVPTSSAAVGSGFTLGLDPGDRQHSICVPRCLLSKVYN